MSSRFSGGPHSHNSSLSRRPVERLTPLLLSRYRRNMVSQPPHLSSNSWPGCACLLVSPFPADRCCYNLLLERQHQTSMAVCTRRSAINIRHRHTKELRQPPCADLPSRQDSSNKGPERPRGQLLPRCRPKGHQYSGQGLIACSLPRSRIT
jgi:hypothetical protein